MNLVERGAVGYLRASGAGIEDTLLALATERKQQQQCDDSEQMRSVASSRLLASVGTWARHKRQHAD